MRPDTPRHGGHPSPEGISQAANRIPSTKRGGVLLASRTSGCVVWPFTSMLFVSIRDSTASSRFEGLNGCLHVTEPEQKTRPPASRRPTFPLPTPAGSLVLTRSARRSHRHAKDQEVRRQTVQAVRHRQADASFSWDAPPRQPENPEAEASAGPVQGFGRGPCQAAAPLPAVWQLTAIPQLRPAGEFPGDPPATLTTLI